ncbi:MAG: hypothetical protein ABR613_08245 [Actinomycetota bacterium]
MSLAADQRAVAALLAGTEIPRHPDPSYVRDLQASPRLGLLRDISLWWRAFRVTRYCPLTAAALERAGVFESILEQFVRAGGVSPLIEQLGPAFLAFVLERHPRGLVHDVARLEDALLRARFGAVEEVELEWTTDPRAVLPSLVSGAPIQRDPPRVRFKIMIGPHLSHYFEVTQITTAATPSKNISTSA